MTSSSRLRVVVTACCLVVSAACADESSSDKLPANTLPAATLQTSTLQTTTLPDGAPDGLPRNCGSIEDRTLPASLAELVDDATLIVVATSTGVNRPLKVPPGSSVQASGFVDEYEVTQTVKGTAPQRIEVIRNFGAYDYVKDIEIPVVAAQWEYLLLLRRWGKGTGEEYLTAFGASGLFIRSRGSSDDRFFAHDCQQPLGAKLTVADVTAALSAAAE